MGVRAKTKGELLNELADLRQRAAELEQKNRVLLDGEDMPHSLLLSSPDPMVVYDTEGRVLFLNSAFTETFGWAKEELLGRRIDYVPEDCLLQTKETLERSLRGEPVPSFDTKRFTKDGRILDIHISSALLRGNEGKPAGHIVTLRDVTERKQTGDKLREREACLQAILNNAPFLMWLKDREGTFLAVNEVFAQSCGQESPEAVVGKTDLDVWPVDLADGYRADDREVMDLKVQKHVEEPIFDRGVTKWFETFKTPILDEDGNAVGTTGFARDITDRKRVEETLREREQQYRLLADNILDVIWQTDLDIRFTYVNPAIFRMMGYTPDEFIGTKIKEHCDEENFMKIAQFASEEISKGVDGSGTTFETVLLRKNKDPVSVEVRGKVVFGKNGLPIGFQGVSRDITDRKRAEEALRESEEKYRLVVQKAQDAILVAQDGVLRFVNPKTVEVMSYTKEELLGKSFTDFLYPDDREMVLDRHMRRLRGEDFPSRYAFRIVEKFGVVKWVEIDSGLISWEGEPAALIFMSDITERMRTEQSLKESEEWYRKLVEESFDGIFVQKGSEIIFANSRLHEMLGYSAGELEGLEHWKVYHPDYQTITRDRAIARMRGEDVVSQYEVKLQRRDGSTFDGEISARAVKVKGEPGVQVWVKDVSKRKRSEEAQRRLATAVEQSAEAIVVTDTTGKIQWVNPAFERISGYTRREAIGKTPNLLKSGEHDRTFYENLWDTITRGQVWSGRFVNKRKDGSIYHEDSTISPVLDSQGKIINFVAVKRDITEHLKLSGQLLQAQKMEAIGTLAGGIAHDFNNLLQVTLGYSELLLAEKREDEPEYADLSKILQAAKSGAELVQRLLTFSRKVEPKPIPLNLNGRILQVEKLLRRTIPKMIDIRLDLSDDLAEINADPNQMEQVLMNLAVNARDAMPDGGKLMIGTKNVTLDEECCRIHGEVKPGEYVLLTVSDTGHGMDKSTVDHIFEPFYTTKELGRGTGLGLAMVYGIVKQHEGLINCYSEVGHGTAFNVYFPVIERQVEIDVEKTGEMPAFGTETILLVDDEEFVRELGARILKKNGYSVLTATNGREALDVLQKNRTEISLVILDLIMPEMGGKECLKELRKIDPELNVVFASGLSVDPSLNESPESGARGFVSKPFRMKELLRQVRKVLDEI